MKSYPSILRSIIRAGFLWIVLLVATIAICQAQQNSSPQPNQQNQSSGLTILPSSGPNQTNPPSAPQINVAVNAPAGYLLAANDSVGVEVFGEDDLKTVGRLNGEGNISLPLIGSVRLGGLTVT